jgi:hypothetical protein
MAEARRRRDANHHRSREEAAALFLGIVLLVKVGEERNDGGADGHGEHGGERIDGQERNRRREHEGDCAEVKEARGALRGQPVAAGDKRDDGGGEEQAHAAAGGHGGLGHRARFVGAHGDRQQKGRARALHDA